VVATATGRARIIDLPVFDPKAITEITSYSVFTDTGDFTDELIAQMHKAEGEVELGGLPRHASHGYRGVVAASLQARGRRHRRRIATSCLQLARAG
jgi:hypothetical protein